MTGVHKPTPLEAFQDNMRDAHHLVRLAEGLTNGRSRRMRKERRERVGAAWDVPARQRDELDCLESDDVYLTFKPGSRLQRDMFEDHRPLLRQALVAACAATETYLADKVMTRVSDLTSSRNASSAKILKLPMTVGDWMMLKEEYKSRPRRGLHGRIIEPLVRQDASTDPAKVGKLLSLIGVSNWSKQLDHIRGVDKGGTEELLARVTGRRNRIVHTGDRQGRGRAALDINQTQSDLEALESVVHAIDKLVV